jgi:hypothetical protein
MSGSDYGIIKQLKMAIEEDRETIRKLRQEVARLRYLLGVQSLTESKSNPAATHAPLHPDFSN